MVIVLWAVWGDVFGGGGGRWFKEYIFLRRSPYSALFYPNSHSYLGSCGDPFKGRGGGWDGVGVGVRVSMGIG